MNILIISQLIIFLIYYKLYKFLPTLVSKDNKDIYSGGYLFAFSLISFAIFSSNPIELQINYIIFPLAAFALGAIDDKFNINPFIRLIIFSIIVFILINNETKFNLNFINFNEVIYKIDFPFDIFFTCLCFLLLINAMNFADGINGLAGLIFTFFYLYMGLRIGIQIDLIIIIISCLIFFLFLNFKNLCFLGDSGVYLLSFLLSQIIIISFKENYQTFLAEEIFILLFMPGFDLFRLFIDRIFQKKNPFKGDENHIHHLLNKKIGLSKTLFIYILCMSTPIILYKILEVNNFICILLCVLIYTLLLTYAKN